MFSDRLPLALKDTQDSSIHFRRLSLRYKAMPAVSSLVQSRTSRRISGFLLDSRLRLTTHTERRQTRYLTRHISRHFERVEYGRADSQIVKALTGHICLLFAAVSLSIRQDVRRRGVVFVSRLVGGLRVWSSTVQDVVAVHAACCTGPLLSCSVSPNTSRLSLVCLRLLPLYHQNLTAAAC